MKVRERVGTLTLSFLKGRREELPVFLSIISSGRDRVRVNPFTKP